VKIRERRGGPDVPPLIKERLARRQRKAVVENRPYLDVRDIVWVHTL
jgi:hypothetical protein